MYLTVLKNIMIEENKMAKLDGWNKLKFKSDGEYYELLGFLSKDNPIATLHTSDNSQSGARSRQNIFRLQGGTTFDELPRVLREAYEQGNDPIRLSETAFIQNIIDNHSFSDKTVTGANDYLTHWHKTTLDDVIATVPTDYLKDFFRGYQWDSQLIKKIRQHSVEEYNEDNTTISERSTAESYTEGKKKQYYTTRYERDSRNRKEAIRIHGTKCMICDFDYEIAYGELGKGYIEVHHIKPLASEDEEVTINPETDLICVCANCHRMLHRYKNYIVSVDELKQIVGKCTNSSLEDRK